MNDNLSDDPDLAPHLGAARDDLISRPPRSDARVEQLLGAAPPMPTSPHDELDPVPVVSLAEERGRRPAAVAGLMAAGIVLIAALAAIAYRGGPDPAVDASLAAPPAAEEDTDGTDSGDADAPDTDAVPFEEHREWVECVLGAFQEALGDDDPPAFHRLDVDPTEACGEPPGLDLDDLEGHFGPFDTEEWQGVWPGPLGDWDPEEQIPGWPGLDLGEWNPEEWADRLDLEGVCQDESSDDGVSVRCIWPPCEDDDVEQTHCFEFGFHFDGDLTIEPGEWPEQWDEWFDREPHDEAS